MSDFYDEAEAVAEELLEEFGQAVTIAHVTSGEYDIETGTVTKSSATENGFGVVGNYTNSSIDGTLILRGDKRLLLSADGVTEPKPQDLVGINGVTHTVINCEPLSPAGTVLIYKCQLRVA